jgi:hypothetical protein
MKRKKTVGMLALLAPARPQALSETLQISRYAPYRVLAARRGSHCSSRLRCNSAVSQRASATLSASASLSRRIVGSGTYFVVPFLTSSNASLIYTSNFSGNEDFGARGCDEVRSRIYDGTRSEAECPE